ncbi:MAG: histidine phosphatase family protein [Chitinivibrionales bacterium]
MTTFLLIRHAECVGYGERITGRSPGVHLTSEGLENADKLARRLSGIPIEHICSSPMERTMDTAAPLARSLGVAVQTCHGLQEIDFGSWTGLSFKQLQDMPRWREWNRFRSGIRVPQGEMICEVQARMVAEIQRLQDKAPEGTVALFSHGDPIKTALAYYLGIPLDNILRLTISPASVSVLQV